MIRLVDLSTNKVIALSQGSNILGRGQHGITDRHCSRKQADALVNYVVQPPTIHIIPLGMNPIRRETAEGMVEVMNRGEASEYTDGAVFALFGEHKYQITISAGAGASSLATTATVIDLVGEDSYHKGHPPSGQNNGGGGGERNEGKVEGDVSTGNNNNYSKYSNYNNSNNNYNINNNIKKREPPSSQPPGPPPAAKTGRQAATMNASVAPTTTTALIAPSLVQSPADYIQFPYLHQQPSPQMSSVVRLPPQSSNGASPPFHAFNTSPAIPSTYPTMLRQASTPAGSFVTSHLPDSPPPHLHPYFNTPLPDTTNICHPYLTSKLTPISSPLLYKHEATNNVSSELQLGQEKTQPQGSRKGDRDSNSPKSMHYRHRRHLDGKLVVIYHKKCLDHNVPEWHLETPDRLRVAINAINDLQLDSSHRVHVVRDPDPAPGPSILSSPLPSALQPHLHPYFNQQIPPCPDTCSSVTSPTVISPAVTSSAIISPAVAFPSISTSPAVSSASSTRFPHFKIISRELLETCHDPGYLDSIMSKIPPGSQPQHATQYSQDEREPDQGDTFVSSGTWDAALVAASVVCLAVDYIANENYLHSFCAVRPPGHHAGIKGRTLDACSQGYCILNNVAIGAMYASRQYPHLFSRVAVVDFDVHHGNGTQEILGSKQGFLFVSIHVGDLYPHTGGCGEKVHVSNHGRVVNISLQPNCAPKTFKKYFEKVVIPKVEQHNPHLIFVSAGFDGHKADPTEGGMRLTKAEYRHVTEQLKAVAKRCCGGKLISVLEGGYHLPSLKKCIEEHLSVLAADDDDDDDDNDEAEDEHANHDDKTTNG